MNIEYLQYYLDVAQTKSITKAAKLNFISPQGMSRAMNELEKETGRELLVRYSNKLSLSPIGEKLVSYVQETVDSYHRMLDFAANEATQDKGQEDTIVLDCQNIAMLAFLPQETKDCIFSSAAVHFRESGNSQIGHDLMLAIEKSNGERLRTIGILCFFAQEVIGKNPFVKKLEDVGYVYKPYLRTYDKVMVPDKSPLAKKETLTNEDIGSMPLVSTNSHLHDFLMGRFGEDAIMLSSPNFSLRKTMVQDGNALSFLPAIADITMPDKDGFVLRDMQRPYSVEIGFVATEEEWKAPLFVQILESLDRFYQAHESSGLYTLYDGER